jgi:hypothetical protein
MLYMTMRISTQRLVHVPRTSDLSRSIHNQLLRVSSPLFSSLLGLFGGSDGRVVLFLLLGVLGKRSLVVGNGLLL